MPRFHALAALALLAGCATAGIVATGREFAMRPGQQVTLPDATSLRYVGVANDSRCPPGVQCIRAGDADVQFDHGRGTTVARVVLNTERAPSITLGARQLQLVELDRGAAPWATLRIDVVTGDSTP